MLKCTSGNPDTKESRRSGNEEDEEEAASNVKGDEAEFLLDEHFDKGQGMRRERRKMNLR